MIKEKKISKYILYAIGEIILVVIGILIALQINNWNEDQKLRATELRLLKEVHSNLESTLAEFKIDTAYNNQTIIYYKDILGYIENDLPYSASLDSAFAAIPLFASPFASTSGYKSIQQQGFDIIQNQELKLEMQNLYDVLLNRLLVDVDKVEWTMSESTVNPFFIQHVRIVNNGSLNTAKPLDFEALKDNEVFVNILNQLIRERTKSVKFYATTIDAIEDLMAKIDRELKTRT